MGGAAQLTTRRTRWCGDRRRPIHPRPRPV